MPMFIIHASDGYSALENTEYDLPDNQAVKYLIKKKLFRLIHDDESGRDPTRFEVYALNKDGLKVVTARMEVIFGR